MMSASRYSRSTILYGAVFLAVAVACGAWLRLWNIGGQFLLDDEWHAVNFAPGKDFLGVLFGQGLGANSIPVNLWSWIVLNGPGWSELWLRLPSLAAGIAAIVAIPLAARRFVPGAGWPAVAAAIAISPVLSFYSRVARPYAPAALLGAASVLLAVLWVRERKDRYIYPAVAAGVLAIWWHLYSIIPVGTALLAAAILAGRQDAREGGRTFVACAITYWRPAAWFAVSLFVLVGIPNLIDPWWLGVFQAGEHASLATLWGVVGIVFGTASAPLKAVCLALFLRGWIAIRSSERELFAVLLPAFLAYAVVATLNRQDGSHVPIQVVRYGIAYVPLALVVATAGLQAALADAFRERARHAWPAALLLGGALAWTGPFAHTYVEPNNFTGHSAFQYDYSPPEWKASRVREFFADDTRLFTEAELPPFYRAAGNPNPGAPSFRGIVEYPVFLGDHYNFLYYFQHFHRLPVAGGFVRAASARFETTDKQIFGNYSVDEVRGVAVSGANWRTLVDIGDIGALKDRCAGWALVVHKEPEREIGAPWGHHDEMGSLVDGWDNTFGGRVYEDDRIVVWAIR